MGNQSVLSPMGAEPLLRQCLSALGSVGEGTSDKPLQNTRASKENVLPLEFSIGRPLCFGVSQLLYILPLSSLKHQYPNPPRSEETWILPSVVSKETSSVPPQVWEHLYPTDLGHVRALCAPASCSSTACRAELLHCLEPALVLLGCEL